MDPISARMVMAAAGAGAAADAVYVEDVYSTFLYEGTGNNRSIVNGFDLSSEDGMVWLKRRDGSTSNYIYDTLRGANNFLEGDTSEPEGSSSIQLTAFNSDGFDLGTSGQVNRNVTPFLSYTFKKQPGFFDIVTYTGDGVIGRTISHSLGSAPGMIWVKCLSLSRTWQVYHRSMGSGQYGRLSNNSSFTSSASWDNTDPTATGFTVGGGSDVNSSGNTYVAYLFAHDDTRFGSTSSESIIKCGSYTGNGSTDGPEIDLGWEPQWLLQKRADGSGDWRIFDTARGIVYNNTDIAFTVNGPAAAEDSSGSILNLTSDGFKLTSSLAAINSSGGNYIYMAIRRPDKAPAAGTDFFQVRTRAGTGASLVSSTNFNVDAGLVKRIDVATSWYVTVRGFPDFDFIETDTNSAIKGGTSNNSYSVRSDEDSTVTYGSGGAINNTGSDYVDYFFKRARGAFDIVFYEGNGSTQNIEHGLGAVPQMIWVKEYTKTEDWAVYTTATGAGKYLLLNSTAGESTSTTYWNNTSPTSSVFSLGNDVVTNNNNNDYVSYLFANLPGIIDIGSYTGTGATGLQIDCGFSSGARYVLIKRTDSTGNWVVFNTASGINAGSDPHLFLNLDSIESSADYLDPYAPGFELSTTTGDLNASGGTYIYMAIA